jgi:hypothetical protein
VPLESVKEMLNSVMQELEDYSEGGPLYKNGCLRSVDSEIKHSTPSPTKYSLSPSKSYKVSRNEMSHSIVEHIFSLNVLNTGWLVCDFSSFFFFFVFFSIPPKLHLGGQKIKILY